MTRITSDRSVGSVSHATDRAVVVVELELGPERKPWRLDQDLAVELAERFARLPRVRRAWVESGAGRMQYVARGQHSGAQFPGSA